MEDDAFETLDEATEALLKHTQLQHKIDQVTREWNVLKQQLSCQNELQSTLEAFIERTEPKLDLFTSVKSTLASLEKCALQQQNSMEGVGRLVAEEKDALIGEIKRVEVVMIEMGSLYERLLGELSKGAQRERESRCLLLEDLVRTKDQQITFLRQTIENMQLERSNQRSNLEAIFNKINHLEERMTPAEKVEYPRSHNTFNRLCEERRQQSRPKQSRPKQSRLNVDQDKYPKSFPMQSDKTQSANSSAIMVQLERLFTKALNSMTTIISKSSKELISQLTERDSLERMGPDYQSHINLDEVRRKLQRIEASSKKAVASLMNEVRSSTSQLMGLQLSPRVAF